MAGVSGRRWWNVDIADRIAVLTFTRPPSNWMSIAAITEWPRRSTSSPAVRRT
jgi:hypothetical protein